jgi:hypothetical protein
MIINKMKLLLFLMFSTLFFTGCFSAEEPKEVGETIVATHYTLRIGEVVKNQKPLPDYTPVLVDWHYSNDAVKPKVGFKGWDFNQDGRFDMLQVMREDGTVDYAVFDFDSDGEIDMNSKFER